MKFENIPDWMKDNEYSKSNNACIEAELKEIKELLSNAHQIYHEISEKLNTVSLMKEKVTSETRDATIQKSKKAYQQFNASREAVYSAIKDMGVDLNTPTDLFPYKLKELIEGYIKCQHFDLNFVINQIRIQCIK